MNGIVSLGKFAFKLKDVDADTKMCILLLKRVYKDIAAADELFRLGYCKWGSRQLKRIADVIRDTRNAGLELAMLIRVSKVKPLSIKNRFRWVMTDKESFMDREKRLNYCHHSLLQIIGTMENTLNQISTPYPQLTSEQYRGISQDSSQKSAELCTPSPLNICLSASFSSFSPVASTQGAQPRSILFYQPLDQRVVPTQLSQHTFPLIPTQFEPLASGRDGCGNASYFPACRWQVACPYNKFDCRGSDPPGAAKFGWLPADLDCCCSSC